MSGIQHDHPTYVTGCHRCELSRDEVDRSCGRCHVGPEETGGLCALCLDAEPVWRYFDNLYRRDGTFFDREAT